MPRILVATRDGLHSIDDVGRPPGFVGRSVTAIARDGAELWAIIDRSEIWHAPAEDDWRLMTTMDGLEATCLAMTDALHVGSSQAHLFRLSGDVLERVVAFDDAEGRSEW